MAVLVWKEAYAGERPRQQDFKTVNIWKPDPNQVLGIIATFTVDGSVIQFAYPIRATGASENCDEVVVNEDHIYLTVIPIGYIISLEPTMYRYGEETDWQPMIEKTFP